MKKKILLLILLFVSSYGLAHLADLYEYYWRGKHGYIFLGTHGEEFGVWYKNIPNEAEAISLIGSGIEGGTVSPDCSETFTISGGDKDDVDGNSMFDLETDASSRLVINDTDDVLKYSAEDTTVGYVRETSCFSNAAEVTIKFKIRFDDITGVDDGTSYVKVAITETSGSSTLGQLRIICASGNVAAFRVHDAVEGWGDEVTMTGVAADTWYDAYLYTKDDASAGGSAAKIGAWTESTSGLATDTSAHDIDQFALGGFECGWGDGETDTHIDFDNVEVYTSDQR